MNSHRRKGVLLSMGVALVGGLAPASGASGAQEATPRVHAPELSNQSVDSVSGQTATDQDNNRDITATLEAQARERVRAEGALIDGHLSESFLIDGIPATEYVDIASLGDAYGLSMAEAIERYGASSDFMDYRDAVSEEFLSEFAFSLTSEDGLVIGFKGAAPESVVEDVSGLPYEVHLVENVGYSRTEIFDYAQELHEAHPVNAVYIDESTGSIELLSESPIVGVTPNSRLDGITVSFVHDSEFNPSNGDEDTLLRGGALVSNGAGLTSFVLQSPTSGAIRMGTCRHCVDAVGTQTRYRLHSMHSSDTTMLNVLNRGSNDLDLAILSHAGWTPTSRFYPWATETRLVTSRNTSWPGIGDPVCVHRRNVNQGPNPGRRCSTVERHSLRNDSSCSGHGTGNTTLFTLADHYISSPGDSGGPWYSGNRAIGTHVGNWCGRNQNSFFVSVHYYQNVWGYAVRTS